MRCELSADSSTYQNRNPLIKSICSNVCKVTETLKLVCKMQCNLHNCVAYIHAIQFWCGRKKDPLQVWCECGALWTIQIHGSNRIPETLHVKMHRKLYRWTRIHIFFFKNTWVMICCLKSKGHIYKEVNVSFTKHSLVVTYSLYSLLSIQGFIY